MKFAQILNDKAHWIFESDTQPEFAHDIIVVEITDVVPQPSEGWSYDGKIFTAPEVVADLPQRPRIALDGITTSDIENTSIDGMYEVTCPVGTTTTVSASIVGQAGDVLPITASFRMPIQSRDGREFVVLAQFVHGVADITVPFSQSGVWSVTEAAINSALPPEQQMSFAGFTVYVVVAA
jgi:hypothetical protein